MGKKQGSREQGAGGKFLSSTPFPLPLCLFSMFKLE